MHVQIDELVLLFLWRAELIIKSIYIKNKIENFDYHSVILRCIYSILLS